MSASISQLRAMSDEQVIAAHDSAAESTIVGTAYWMDELERRSRERATRSNSRLARASLVLSVASVLVALTAILLPLLPDNGAPAGAETSAPR